MTLESNTQSFPYTTALRHFKRNAGILVFLLLAVACTSDDPVTPTVPELPPIPSLDVEQLGTQVRNEFTAVQQKLETEPLNGHYNNRFARLLHAHLLHAPAAVMYQRCRLLRPSDLECVYLEAITLRLLGDNKSAASLLTELLGRKPNFPRASVVLADIYRQQGSPDRARPLFEKAVKANKEDLEAVYGLAMSLHELGDVDRATELLNSLHKNGRNFGIVHAALATIQRQKGELEEAAFSTAAASRFADSKIPFVDAVLWAVQDEQVGDERLVREARALFAKGSLREAADAYVRATVADPDNLSNHVGLIGIYGQLGHLSGAQRHFKRAREISPNDVVPLVAMGTVHMKRGAFADARELFNEVVTLRPSHGEARTLSAYCANLLGGPIEPDELQRALKDDPTQSLAHYLLGRHLASTQSCSAALPHLLSSIRLESAQTPAYVPELVRCLVETGDLETARRQIASGKSLATHYRNRNAQLAIEQIEGEYSTQLANDSAEDGGT